MNGKTIPNKPKTKNLNTLKGAISLKQKEKVRKAKDIKKAKSKKLRDKNDPISKVKFSDQNYRTKLKDNEYEHKGKLRKVPSTKMTPAEKIKMLLEIAQNIPEDYIEQNPEIPTDAKTLDELIEKFSVDLEYKDPETKLKVLSKRTGHELPADLDTVMQYLTNKKYADKFKKAAGLKDKYDLDNDWRPFLKPANDNIRLFSVLRGKFINKDIFSISKELNCIKFKQNLVKYLDNIKAKEEKRFAHLNKIKERNCGDSSDTIN